MKLHYDNQLAIEISENLIQHEKTKHLDVDINFIK